MINICKPNKNKKDTPIRANIDKPNEHDKDQPNGPAELRLLTLPNTRGRSARESCWRRRESDRKSPGPKIKD
jgi:hypothetical protein